MRNCPSLADLANMLDGELAQSRRKDFYAHIENCLVCQQALDRLSDDNNTLISSASYESTLFGDDPLLHELIKRLSENPRMVVPMNIECRRQESDDAIRFPQPPTPSAPLGRLGLYNILDRIGGGSTGIVFKAVDTSVGRNVAIKVLRGELASSESYRKRLRREAKAVASLNHDHIVRVYQVGCENDFPPYLVMEYVDGQSLRDRLLQMRRLAPSDAARIVYDVSLALHAAHQQGWVHRDIKPANILLESSSGRAKVTDFGLARDGDASNRITVEGDIAGTPAYISPERIEDPDVLDVRSDVYSLGIVLYELLTGYVPFWGDVPKTLFQILNEDPRPPRELNNAVPHDLDSLCLKAIAKKPHRRHQSASELANDLQRFLDH